MKNLFIYIFILTSTASAAFAQKDADAKTILSGVAQKYRSYNTVKSDFTINISSPQENVNQTQSGTLVTQAKANKYKLSFYGNASKTVLAQEITSDGKSQWTYMPAQKEVQINSANTAEGINPAQIFTLYENGYKYIYTGLQKQAGKTYQVVELTPTDAKQSIFKIRLLIDKLKKQIHSAQLFDKNGSRYTYAIGTLTPNVSVAADAFTFNPKTHPGVEVVDLR